MAKPFEAITKRNVQKKVRSYEIILVGKNKDTEKFIRPYNLHVKVFHHLNPYFYREDGMFYVWEETTCVYVPIDVYSLINTVSRVLQLIEPITSSNEFKEYVHRLKVYGEKNRPEELPKQYIQFKDKYYDVNKQKFYPATPKYFNTNYISYSPSKDNETPTIDRLFKSWVGADKILLLKEIFAYCLYQGMPIHKIFVFAGHGRNGKSQLLKMMRRYFGMHNVVAANLKNLTVNRFATYPLYRKLAVLMGETERFVLESTTILKEMSGGDLITYERKGADSFSDENYTKIVMSTNHLPVTNDDSVGFYRRWLIIKFPNTFQAGKDVFEQITDAEYCAFSRQLVKILPKLIQRGAFSYDPTDDEAKEAYLEYSNPIVSCVNKIFHYKHPHGCTKEVLVSEFALVFNRYLSQNGFARLSMRQIQNRIEKSLDGVTYVYDREYAVTSIGWGTVCGFCDAALKNESDVPPDNLVDEKVVVEDVI